MKTFLLLLLALATTQAEQENIKRLLPKGASQVGYIYSSTSEGKRGDTASGYSLGVYSNGVLPSGGYSHGGSVPLRSGGYSNGRVILLHSGYDHGGSSRLSLERHTHKASLGGGFAGFGGTGVSSGQVQGNTIPEPDRRPVPVSVPRPVAERIPVPVPQAIPVQALQLVPVSLPHPGEVQIATRAGAFGASDSFGYSTGTERAYIGDAIYGNGRYGYYKKALIQIM